jgi:hypothetical protein
VVPVGGLRKRHRGRNLAAERSRKPRNGPGETMDPGRNWPPPAEGHAVQEWHGVRDTVVKDMAGTMW